MFCFVTVIKRNTVSATRKKRYTFYTKNTCDVSKAVKHMFCLFIAMYLGEQIFGWMTQVTRWIIGGTT